MTRTSSNKILAWLLISTCILAVGPSCRSKDPTDDKAVGSKDDALRLDLRPTYGPLGSERPSTFIAGELLCFAATASGIRATSEGKYDCDYEYKFTDPSGKEVVRTSGRVKDLLLRGSEFAWPIVIKTAMSASPGQHTLQLSVRDNVTGQTAEKTLPVSVLEKNRFVILNACLYRDSEHLHAAGGNVTAGGRVYAKCHVRVPKNHNNESRAETVITLHDRDNKTIYRSEPLRIENTNPTGNGWEFAFYDDFLISEIGLYRIHIATKDLSTGATRQCDLPLSVHASPKAPVVQAGSAGRKRQRLAEPSPPLIVGEESTLSLEVHPTLGYLGCPCDAHIAQGGKLSFSLTVRGLSTGADGKASCVVTLSGFGPAVSDPFRETFSETARVLSKNRSLVVTCDLRHGALLKPGHFTGRFEVRDKATNKSVSKEIAMSFGADEFAFGAFAFYCDEEARVRLAPNLTVGDKVNVRQAILLPKKSNTNDIEQTVSVLDEGGHVISRTVTKREEWFKYAMDPSEYTVILTGLVVNRPGSFRLRYELKDLVTKETITREIPFNVFPPPELPAKGP